MSIRQVSVSSPRYIFYHPFLYTYNAELCAQLGIEVPAN